ncbi:MAG: S-methyl-5-thioribose-1-phosphate isomerase [Clostridiales bacterium]|nr:S-methyl-5-thioribose-1-phosphate isomerase [Clostridiales bacterium]
MDNIRYDEREKKLYVVDQTLLPNEEKEILLDTAEEMYDAIKLLKVRGAPAIGICAGYCLYVLSLQIKAENGDAFCEELKKKADYLNSSRPTAVNLSWALKRMVAVAEKNSALSGEALRARLLEEARAIHNEDIEMCRSISELGLSLVKDGYGILTHCNAGPLATSRYGTALGPILLGTERGMKFKVFADETRPLLQGARLTSYELFKAGVDVTLICDNMANTVMRNGWVQAVFVGCDRIAANGDTANKIGTCGVAVLAKHYGIPFYVLGPTSTIDMNSKTGADIKIEERDPDEIKTMFYAKPMAPLGVKCFNPAFDVTDNNLITAIVTE